MGGGNYYDYLSDEDDEDHEHDEDAEVPLDAPSPPLIAPTIPVTANPVNPAVGFPLPWPIPMPVHGPPDIQVEPVLFSQLENARRRLNSRPTSSRTQSPSQQEEIANPTQSASEGTVTSTIRTELPYRRTVQVSESTLNDGAERHAQQQYSTSFLILMGLLVAVAASVATAGAVITYFTDPQTQ